MAANFLYQHRTLFAGRHRLHYLFVMSERSILKLFYALGLVLLLGSLFAIFMLFIGPTYHLCGTFTQKTATDEDFVFVGGSFSSGQDVMCKVLSELPEVECRGDSSALSWFLSQNKNLGSLSESSNAIDNICNENFDIAAARFAQMALRNDLSTSNTRLSYYDSTILKHSSYLSKVFPQSKFLFMVRDGRSAVLGADLKNNQFSSEINPLKELLYNWDQEVNEMFLECSKVGRKRCLLVVYEQFLLYPEEHLKIILGFLGYRTDIDTITKMITNSNLSTLPKKSYDFTTLCLASGHSSEFKEMTSEKFIGELPEIAPYLWLFGYNVTNASVPYDQMNTWYKKNYKIPPYSDTFKNPFKF